MVGGANRHIHGGSSPVGWRRTHRTVHAPRTHRRRVSMPSFCPRCHCVVDPFPCSLGRRQAQWSHICDVHTYLHMVGWGAGPVHTTTSAYMLSHDAATGTTDTRYNVVGDGDNDVVVGDGINQHLRAGYAYAYWDGARGRWQSLAAINPHTAHARHMGSRSIQQGCPTTVSIYRPSSSARGCAAPAALAPFNPQAHAPMRAARDL